MVSADGVKTSVTLRRLPMFSLGPGFGTSEEQGGSPVGSLLIHTTFEIV